MTEFEKGVLLVGVVMIVVQMWAIGSHLWRIREWLEIINRRLLELDHMQTLAADAADETAQHLTGKEQYRAGWINDRLTRHKNRTDETL